MKLTKANIVNRVNKQAANYRVTWDDIVDDLDEAIEEINSYMSTKYPPVSKILNDNSPAEKTYSFRAGGVDVDFFPEKYFMSIVISYVVTKILSIDEEFTTIFSYHSNRFQENLFIMARDEMNNIPYQFISAPKGVYFANPDPQFKQDPEKYFNQKIVMDVPKIRVFYSWGNYKSMVPFNTQTFIEKPLPKDPNAYETGFKYMPIMMAGENYSTYIVDYSQKVLGVFLGWSLKDDNKAEGIVQSPIDLYEDVTFYAVFDLDIVGIKYNGNGGTIHNWRPTYVTKSELNSSALSPMGGTAFRKGYRFVGFELEKKNELILEEDYDVFEEQNDVVAEQDVTFKALWYRMIYKISYIGAKGNFATKKINYTFGQEFDLENPAPTDSEPDEFIGWWDNPKFLGDRITKINESDYGDKTFYAKYNDEKYRIRWIGEDGIIIKEEFLTRGAFLTEPVKGKVKENAWIDGLLHRFEYIGFIDEYNQRFKPGITRAKRNTDLTVVFSEPIDVMMNLIVDYKVNEEGSIKTKKLYIRKQVGSEIDVDLDILQYLSNDGLNAYEDLTSVQHFVKSISFITDGTVEEDEYAAGDKFTIEEEIDYEVSCNYDTTFWTVNFRKKTFSNGIYTLSDSVGTHSFVDNATKELIENKGASYLDILYEAQFNQNEYEYLQGFKVLAENDEEVDMPANIGSDLTLVPYYGPTVNAAFVKTLEIIGMPLMDHPTEKQTITQHHRIGTEVSLLAIKQITETNQYKYMRINKFFANLLDDSPGDEIDSDTITLNNNKTIHVQTVSKKLYSVIFKNYSDLEQTYNLKVMDYYPFHFESGNISFNTQANQPITTSYLGTEYVHKGWSENDGWGNNALTITLLENRGEDYILYPIFVKLGKIIINFTFKTNTETPLLTNYRLDSTFKRILTFDKLGSNVELYSQYSTFIGDLNSSSSLISDNSIQPQQIGYNFNKYRVDGGEWNSAMPIIVNLVDVDQSQIEDKDKEMTIEIELIRNPLYAHLVIGDSSKPNDTLNSGDIDTHTGVPVHQRNKFVTKGLTFNELISNGQIPALSPYEGEPLYYCYWDASEPYSISDVTYSATVGADMKIYIKDTVEGLHQFRIIYQEPNGEGGFTTLKTMHVYQNQLSQYGSIWTFDINDYKPSNPQKYGYLFKGYSSPVSDGEVATQYGIDTSNTEDIYFTAVYSAFGKINVNFKVKAESGSLITDYDLTGDLDWSDMGVYSFQKQYNFDQRVIHYLSAESLLNEFKESTGNIERAQMGYDVVGFRVDYPAGVVSSNAWNYQRTGYQSPYIELNNVKNYAIDGKNCDITFTFILRRKSTGYVHVEVLERSLPNSTGQLLSGNELLYRKFFMQWGETILDVKEDFDTNLEINPLYDLSIYGEFSNYYTHNTGGGYTVVNDSYEANSSKPQNIQIFVRDDI